MSSVAEKSKLVEGKRSFFLRSGSLEKIKCSAKYPFRLAGIALSKAAIIELLEEIIVKSRIQSHKAFLILFIAIFKFVSVLLSFVVDASAKCLAKKYVCDNKTKLNLDYYERLQEKLNKLRKHKSRMDSFQLKKTDDSLQSSTSNIIQNNSTSNKIPIAPLINLKTQERLTDLSSPKNDTKFSEFHAEIKKMRTLSEKNCMLNESSTLSVSILSGSSSLSNINSKDFQRICLFPIVYGSIAFMYLQIIFLAIALNTTCIPPGLIFLIGSLLFVAFITFKVFFIEKFRKINIKAVSRQKTKLKQTAELRQSVEAIEQIEYNKRQSRNRLKKVFDLNSKIKCL